jgi:hypothetical protein
MSAVVVMLFDRFAPFKASNVDRSPEATMRRVGFAARAAGCCDPRDLQLVRAHAQGLINGGMPPHQVVQAARSYAEKLLPKVPA